VTNTSSAYSVFRDRLLALRVRPGLSLFELIRGVGVTVRPGTVGLGNRDQSMAWTDGD
jgi:hypothetical protein